MDDRSPAANETTTSPHVHAGANIAFEEAEFNFPRLIAPLGRNWVSLAAAIVVAGALGAAGSFLFQKEFTSTTTFIPPQQQGGAASALASLGALGALAGGAVGIKSPADEYVSLMESVTVSDRLIDRFDLAKVYGVKYRSEARKVLADHVRIMLGKRDGLISVAVDDVDPARAARMANQYVDELRQMVSSLAISEAKQRRVFFEDRMQETKARLVAAQVALQQSGIGAGAIKSEPQAAAEQYARLSAQATAADVRLQTLRNSLADTAPQVRQQITELAALRSQLELLSSAAPHDSSGADYIGKYREFKYQETLFELMAKQYEIARVDESRDGELIQVVDSAQPAELKSRPKRALMAIGAALLGGLLMAMRIMYRDRPRPLRAN